MEILLGLTHWTWWIIALALLIVEVLVSGTFFLWMGISAGIVGFVLLVFPGTSWEVQLLIFSLLSIIAIASWRTYQKKHPEETDQPTLNRRGEQYIGRVFTLDKPIVNGVGKIQVDDTTWRIRGSDLSAGLKIKVVAIDNTILEVEPYS